MGRGLAPYPGVEATALEAAARCREASAMRLELLGLLGEDGHIPVPRLRCAATGLQPRQTPRQGKARADAGQLRIDPTSSRQGSKGAGPCRSRCLPIATPWAPGIGSSRLRSSWSQSRTPWDSLCYSCAHPWPWGCEQMFTELCAFVVALHVYFGECPHKGAGLTCLGNG